MARTKPNEALKELGLTPKETAYRKERRRIREALVLTMLRSGLEVHQAAIEATIDYIIDGPQ